MVIKQLQDRKKSFNRGFSIVETIVAIAILSIAMVAPLSLAQRGLNSSVYARDQVTAFYLAQEGIEYAHYVRDTNNLAGQLSQTSAWLSGLDNPASLWGIDLTANPKAVDCQTDLSLCRVTFNSNTGIYGRQTGTGWSNTIFTRTLNVKPFAMSGNQYAGAELTTTVSWQTGAISRNVVIKEKIFDWFPTI